MTLSPQCAAGAHHACRPDQQHCSCHCGRNSHPSNDGYGPDGPGEEQHDLEAREQIGMYDTSELLTLVMDARAS